MIASRSPGSSGWPCCRCSASVWATVGAGCRWRFLRCRFDSRRPPPRHPVRCTRHRPSLPLTLGSSVGSWRWRRPDCFAASLWRRSGRGVGGVAGGGGGSKVKFWLKINGIKLDFSPLTFPPSVKSTCRSFSSDRFASTSPTPISAWLRLRSSKLSIGGPKGERSGDINESESVAFCVAPWWKS